MRLKQITGLAISIHASVREATRQLQPIDKKAACVSIHASREGGDSPSVVVPQTYYKNFNPRLREEATYFHTAF